MNAWGIALLFAAGSVQACSCATNPPFLAVAHKAPLIVHGRIEAHEGKSRAGGPLVMEVRVLEVWKGQSERKRLRVQGGDGWLCRPEISEFPVGSEWLLAFDGPGSKPGMSPDHGLSSCGQYWLRVANDRAHGRISREQEKESLPLAEIRARLAHAAGHLSLQGEITGGSAFVQEFGPNLVFRLQPMAGGWEIVVEQKGREENLARLTPPLHFAPNPRFIEAPHFFASTQDRAQANVPGKERRFIFSPEVGQSIAGPTAERSPSPQEIEQVGQYGHGTLTIVDLRGNTEMIERMRFTLELHWQP